MKICEPSESAFPTQVPWELRDKAGNISIVQHNWRGGLTKREYFAACAMQAMCVGVSPLGAPHGTIASQAVIMADALIDALNKEGT